MKEQMVMKETNRREMLKLSTMGMLGGAAVNALTTGTAQAAAGLANVSYGSWIHGHSMQIEYPDQIARQWRAGFGITVEGKPGTQNWFHFAIPTPVIIDDVHMQVDSVMLRFETGSVDAFVREVHVFDGSGRIAEFTNLFLSKEQSFVRLGVPGTPQISWGLGISLGVSFGVEAMAHDMVFYAAGCDFVIRPSA